MQIKMLLCPPETGRVNTIKEKHQTIPFKDTPPRAISPYADFQFITNLNLESSFSNYKFIYSWSLLLFSLRKEVLSSLYNSALIVHKILAVSLLWPGN